MIVCDNLVTTQQTTHGGYSSMVDILHIALRSGKVASLLVAQSASAMAFFLFLGKT
jgi:hypothetical protein